ncbi:MAG: TonB-dependent receptor [Alphaproteobacteria bacterium]|nr:TonB-dependent receptor [Alphaproteobacteria bacterium]
MGHFVRSSFFVSVSAGALIAATPAIAQVAPAVAATDPGTAPAAEPTESGQSAAGEGDSEIVVTGFRASLQNALSQKRRSNQIIDAITAEDIADFPDANLAESIQRLPGVSIDRDNGEGRTITVRGLGGDFQTVRLNGVDAQAVAGGNTSDAGANRSRGFDFNTFASELFGNITVTKTTSASNDEGSLGAIIDLTTGRPLTYKKDRIALGGEAEYRENGKRVNPRFTGLFSKHISDTFGILGSIAYQKQRQQIDSYRRSIGSFEYAYRNTQHLGKTPNVFGFAQPGNLGTGPTYGSDPAAYALITPTTIIPALPSINRQDLSYERLGATLTAQWKPTSHTEVILDGVFSRYSQDSTTNGLTTIGLNRNGTNLRVQQNTLRAAGTANGNADRVALYPNCVQSATIDCGTALYGGGVVPGMLNSMNPNNLNPFDYYNNPASPGFVPTANQTGYFNELIGRPGTKIRAAHVNDAGHADYLLLDDVDWRSSADAQFGTTRFKQASLNLRQDFTDTFRADATLGWSQSKFKATGLLAEFNAIDKDNYTFDERDGGMMPIFNPGFDVSAPGNWSLVKGLSTIRYFNNITDNTYKVGRLNFAWQVVPQFTLRWGATYKQFDYVADQGRRSQDIEAINPTLAEAHLQITDLGHNVGFGQGLDVTAGTPTSFYAPDLEAFRRQFGIDCNCINKWGDFRAVVDGRQRNSVTEKDLSGFVQADYDFELFGKPLRGDLGVRVARTRVTGNGSVGATDGVLGLPVTAHNEYTDWLPSMNANYEVARDFLIRFAASKTIARPQLASLTPGTTSFASGLNATAAPAVTVGNPYLSPFRSTNLDLSFERYFGSSGLLGVAFFYKDLKSFPQQIATEAPLSSVFEPAIYQAVLASMTSPTLHDYTVADGTWAIRQFQDAPGGKIKGFEINAQTAFTFLPAPFNNLGITANYTHIASKLSYLTNTVLATTRTQAGTAQNSFATGPFLNTSPDAFNATLYYETSKFSARVSGAWRKRYVNRFPLAAGTCSVGTTTNNGGPCNSPVIGDFGYNENQLNVDGSIQYSVTDYVKLTLEGRNLTNAPSYRTMYADDPVAQTYQSTGRIITAGVRVTF